MLGILQKQKKEQSDSNCLNLEGEYLFLTKVVGGTYDSFSGKSRQRVIRKLKRGDLLSLKPDFDHRYFKNAVAVLNRNKQDIGHLPSRYGAGLRHEFESGQKFFAVVKEVTGGLFEDNYVNIEVYRYGKKVINRSRPEKVPEISY